MLSSIHAKFVCVTSYQLQIILTYHRRNSNNSWSTITSGAGKNDDTRYMKNPSLPNRFRWRSTPRGQLDGVQPFLCWLWRPPWSVVCEVLCREDLTSPEPDSHTVAPRRGLRFEIHWFPPHEEPTPPLGDGAQLPATTTCECYLIASLERSALPLLPCHPRVECGHDVRCKRCCFYVHIARACMLPRTSS